MEVATQQYGTVTLIKVDAEELTAEVVDLVRQVLEDLMDQGQYRLVFDFSKARLMDSFFLALLVLAYKEISLNGGEIKIVGLSTDLKKTLMNIRFDRLFLDYETLGDALLAFGE